MKPRSVFVVQYSYYPDQSAVAQLLQDLLVRLTADHGCAVTVLAGSRGRRAEQVDGVFVRRPVVSRLERNLPRALSYTAYAAWIFCRLLFRRRIDVVLVLTTPPLIGFFAALALWFRPGRMVHYVEDLYPELFYDLGYLKQPLLIRKLGLLNRIVFRRAQAIVTIGEYMARRVRLRYRVRGEKISVVHNWSHETGYQTPQANLPFRLVYSGNMGLAHDFSALPELIRQLTAYPDFWYDFVGGGERAETLRRMFLHAGEDRVRFAGYTQRTEVGHTLGRAGVLLISQRQTSVGAILPSKFYSYLAAGRPMLYLGPERSEIADLIGTHDIGIVLSGSHAVHRAVEYLLYVRDNPVYARGAGLRARQLFEERFQFSAAYGKLTPVILADTGHVEALRA